jgi:hypothetical protein
MEELVGPERARKVIEWKQGDHYKAIYSIALNQREQVEGVLNRRGVKWRLLGFRCTPELSFRAKRGIYFRFPVR